MKYVNTVTGPLSIDDLGRTLMHEHLVSSCAGVADNYPEANENAFDTVCADLEDMKSNGISTVVDATAFDLGRDEKMLKKCSEATGVSVIASTGFFKEPDPGLGRFPKDKIASWLIREILEGIKDTGIRPGVLKTAMDTEGPTEGRELIHRAVAIASRECRFPVMLHSCPEQEAGRHQIRFFQEEGADLSRVKIDHCLETDDLDYIKWLYDQGVWLGVDRLPRVCISAKESAQFPTIAQRVGMIRRMLDAGLGDRMLFAHDFIAVSSFFDHLPSKESQEYVDGMNPQRFSYLQKTIFRLLEDQGVDPDLLDRMLIDNPKRFFEGC